MADHENLVANLRYLAEGNAIPETDPGHLGDHVKTAIDELTKEQMDMLIELANKAHAHLFVHDKNNHVVAMGL